MIELAGGKFCAEAQVACHLVERIVTLIECTGHGRVGERQSLQVCRSLQGGCGIENLVQIARTVEDRPSLLIVGLAGPPKRRTLQLEYIIDAMFTQQGNLL